MKVKIPLYKAVSHAGAMQVISWTHSINSKLSIQQLYLKATNFPKNPYLQYFANIMRY